jgi:hypothetical protein
MFVPAARQWHARRVERRSSSSSKAQNGLKSPLTNDSADVDRSVHRAEADITACRIFRANRRAGNPTDFLSEIFSTPACRFTESDSSCQLHKVGAAY